MILGEPCERVIQLPGGHDPQLENHRPRRRHRAAPVSGLGFLFLDTPGSPTALISAWSSWVYTGFCWMAAAGKREGERVEVWGDSIKDTWSAQLLP